MKSCLLLVLELSEQVGPRSTTMSIGGKGTMQWGRGLADVGWGGGKVTQEKDPTLGGYMA